MRFLVEFLWLSIVINFNFYFFSLLFSSSCFCLAFCSWTFSKASLKCFTPVTLIISSLVIAYRFKNSKFLNLVFLGMGHGSSEYFPKVFLWLNLETVLINSSGLSSDGKRSITLLSFFCYSKAASFNLATGI